jgi:hypothetical protein
MQIDDMSLRIIIFEYLLSAVAMMNIKVQYQNSFKEQHSIKIAQ